MAKSTNENSVNVALKELMGMEDERQTQEEEEKRRREEEERQKREQEEQAKAQAFLGKAFFAAIAIILLILLTQFNSFVTPFIILTSVVLSLVGVFIGLLVTGTAFGVIMTGIGVISLAGE